MHIWSRFYQRSLASLFKTPSTFFLRRTAGNYTTAILNAHPESSNKNKAKACSARLTVNPWGSPALPSTLLPAPHPREHPPPPQTVVQCQSSSKAPSGLGWDWTHSTPPVSTNKSKHHTRAPSTLWLPPHSPQLPHRPVILGIPAHSQPYKQKYQWSTFTEPRSELF